MGIQRQDWHQEHQPSTYQLNKIGLQWRYQKLCLGSLSSENDAEREACLINNNPLNGTAELLTPCEQHVAVETGFEAVEDGMKVTEEDSN